MSVFSHIIAQTRNRIRRVICDAVFLEDAGVYPYTVSFPFVDLQFTVRADRVKVFFGDLFPIQESFFQKKFVAFHAGILLDIIRHKVQRFLFAIAFKTLADLPVLESDRKCYMDMSINDTRHDEFPFKICNLSFKIRKAGLIANIDELAVFDRQGRCQRHFFICSEYFRIFNDLICFHMSSLSVSLSA